MSDADAALARIERKQAIYEQIVARILGTLEVQTKMLGEMRALLQMPAGRSETAETLRDILAELRLQSGALLDGSADQPEC